MFKVFFGLCLLSINLTLLAGVRPTSKDAGQDRQIKQLQQKVDESTEETVQGQIGGKRPSSRGCYVNTGEPYVVLEYLYWRAQNHGFPVGLQFSGVNLSVNIDPDLTFLGAPVPSKTLRPDFQWDSGYRIGLGWNTNYDSWDVFLNYTYYHNNTADTFNANFPANPNVGILPLWLLEIEAVGRLKSKWIFNENLIDLEIGRAYFITKAVSFKPFMGFRWGWLYQDFTLDATVGDGDLNIPAHYDGENNFYGGGPRAGLNTDWYFCKGFSLFANVSTSILYGRINTKQQIRQFVQNSNGVRGNFTIHRNKDKLKELQPTLQMLLGLSWGSCLHQDKMYFGLRLGWEVNYWFNQNHQAYLADDLIGIGLINKPISQEGITAQARLDF